MKEGRSQEDCVEWSDVKQHWGDVYMNVGETVLVMFI